MRVLIVEDEFLIAMDTEAVLEDAGCEVGGVAATVQEAQRLIDGNGWDAAVVDANLNGVSAEPVAARLRQRGVPFVVMSGYAPDHMTGALAQAPFLSKPSEPNSLASAVLALHK
ncbi:response regulator [Methylocystis echinoides]|jgi:DNA-binding response OmpR family regulator|uniref:response regulator n=1 Tax=Methylocystis echinoides TaxID=29468 RepID=UPI00343C25F5